MKRFIVFTLIFIFGVCMMGVIINICNLEDPFSFERVSLSSDYVLERFSQGGENNDDDLYYVVDTRTEETMGGVFEGIVQKIHVKNDVLYALVQKCYGGDVDGVYKLNIQTGKVTGTLFIEDSHRELIDTALFFNDHRTLFWGLIKLDCNIKCDSPDG